MKTILINRFGELLLNRDNGQHAYTVIRRDYLEKDSNEIFFCDFQGVKVLAPSYCDEVFGRLQEEYPNRLCYDLAMSEALKASFQTVEETRSIHFQFQSA
jgi:hypothetical protein